MVVKPYVKAKPFYIYIQVCCFYTLFIIAYSLYRCYVVKSSSKIYNRCHSSKKETAAHSALHGSGFDPLLYIKTWLCSSTGVTVHAAVCSVCDPQSGWLHALLSERTDGQVYAHLQGTQHYTSFACEKEEEVTVSMSGAVQFITSLLSGQGENGLCVCCAPTHSCSIKEVTTLVLFLNADCHSVRHQLKVGRISLETGVPKDLFINQLNH